MENISKEKLKKAKELKIEVKEIATEIELDKLIEEKEAEVKLAAEKAEAEKAEKEIKKAEALKAAEHAKKTKIVLKDTLGNEVSQKDYFFPDLKNGNTETAPIYFNKICGLPVEREDMIEVFNSTFGNRKGFLLYKLMDKEIYLIIVPLEYSTVVSKFNDSEPGDFQKHALSFITEGSVNKDSLKMKLEKIANHSSIRKEPQDRLA